LAGQGGRETLSSPTRGASAPPSNSAPLEPPGSQIGVDPVTGRQITGFTENGWVRLSLLHALFALEHNAICDKMKKHTRSGTMSVCSSRRGL